MHINAILLAWSESLSANIKLVFVAYGSKDKTLTSMITTCVRKANSKPIPVKYEPWEYNDIPGYQSYLLYCKR